jgi:hypothetical protein
MSRRKKRPGWIKTGVGWVRLTHIASMAMENAKTDLRVAKSESDPARRATRIRMALATSKNAADALKVAFIEYDREKPLTEREAERFFVAIAEAEALNETARRLAEGMSANPRRRTRRSRGR